jgi:hypothetical protein
MPSLQPDTSWQVDANGFNLIRDIDAMTTVDGKVEGVTKNAFGNLPLENASGARALALDLADRLVDVADRWRSRQWKDAGGFGMAGPVKRAGVAHWLRRR